MTRETGSTRRDLLKLGAMSLFGLRAAFGDGVPAEARETIQKPGTPADALDLLVEGNKRFMAQSLLSIHEDLDLMKAQNGDKQAPFAGILSCADSRVPVELVLDQSIGHLFVVRVAGNVATPDTIASLEYGAAVLGVKVILVLGHTDCGAVRATIAGKAVPGQISSLYPYIHPAVAGPSGDLTSVIRRNASLQAGLLGEASPVLAGLVAEKKLMIQAGIYDVKSGQITLLQG